MVKGNQEGPMVKGNQGRYIFVYKSLASEEHISVLENSNPFYLYRKN